MSKNEFAHIRDIEYFDGPIVSLLRGMDGCLYIEKWADLVEIDGKRCERTIIVKTTDEAVASYEAGELLLIDLLVTPAAPLGLLADYVDDGCVLYSVVTVAQLDRSYLCAPDARHDPHLRPAR